MWLIILLLILTLIFFPILGIIFLILYIIYKIFKNKIFKKSKSIKIKNKFNNKEFLIKDKKIDLINILRSILNDNYKRIYLDKKIEIYKLNNYIALLKSNLNWRIVLIVKVVNQNIKNDFNLNLFKDSFLFNYYLVYYKDELYFIIKEDIFAVKLTKELLKKRILSLLVKLNMFQEYFYNKNFTIEIVPISRGELILT